MTTNNANNLKICYLIIVVPQCMYSWYKFSSLLAPEEGKEKKGEGKVRKEEKEGTYSLESLRHTSSPRRR